jgi:hypothetical protein
MCFSKDVMSAASTTAMPASRKIGLWGLEFHEWQGSDGPQYGQVADLDAAKAAFRAAWERRPTNT